MSYRTAVLIVAGFSFAFPVRGENPSKLEPLAKLWRQYETKSRDFSGRLKFGTRMTYKGKSWVEKRDLDIRRNGPESLVSEIRFENAREQPPTVEQAVTATNPDYAFYLERSKDGRAWVLAGLDQSYRDASKLGEQGGEPLATGLDTWCDYAVSVSGRRLTDWIAQPGFQLTKYTERADGLVEFQFACASSYKKRTRPPWNPLQEATVVVDPKAFGCVREMSGKTNYSNGPGETAVTYKYRDGGEVPLLAQVHEISTRDGKVYRDETIDLDLDARTFDPAVFTLTHYGLPEPPGARRPPGSYWWAWLTLGAVALLAAGTGLRWWARRKARSQGGHDVTPSLYPG